MVYVADYSKELQEKYFSSIKELKDGAVVKGKVVEIGKREVVIDIGFKAEGIVLKDEFFPADVPAVGSEVDLYIENVEDDDGKLVVSYNRAKKMMGWKQLAENHDEKDIVEGVVSRKVKGGFMVSVFGCDGFLPGSLSTFINVPDDQVIGQKFRFQIVKLSKQKQNFIVSRKDALRLEREDLRNKLWEEMKVGEVRKGRVKGITDFGAFVDLGGVDGLVHIGDMSWKKINHPSELVSLNDEISVMILNIEKESKKVSLGMKQLTPDPWSDIENKFPAATTVKGKVVNILNYGVFVELERGIEGLVHVSELTWGSSKINIADMFKIGDEIEVKIINVDTKNRKISLSVKQLARDPWTDMPEGIEINGRATGKVIGFAQDAAIVELTQGIEGVVYNKDLSWTKRVSRPQEILKKNQEHEFMVLEIEKDNRRVVLGLKQLHEDPWPAIVDRYSVGRVLETEVVKLTDFGVFVKLEDDLEGLIFSDEIEEQARATIAPGQMISARVIKVDAKNGKIGLSAKV
jgi:small subunit ribosomal protein S1